MAIYTDDACLFSSVVFETSWLWLFPIFLQSDVVWNAQREGRGIYLSTQVFISGWNRSFARAPAPSFVQVSVCGWNRNFDGGGTGLATEWRGLSARASSAEGTFKFYMRQVKCRESRLLHKLHLHPRQPRSTRSSADTCKFSGVSGLLRSRTSEAVIGAQE